MEELDVTPVSPIVTALIDSYKDHIKTLQARVAQLEGNKTLTPVGPPLSMSPKPLLRNRLRTTSEMIAALEKQNGLNVNKEKPNEEVS
jgi:hypothetical protein